MDEEKLDFSRRGVIKIYERMLAGKMTEEDFHRAAENTEALLEGSGADIKVRYMGTIESKIAKRDVNLVKEFMEYTVTLPEWRRPRPHQTKLFEEE